MKTLHIAILSIVVSLSITALTVVGVARAARDNSVEIRAGETHSGALVVAGDQVLINGDVDGDVIAAASTITINGAVHGSVYLGGQTITINGPVSGGIHAAGSEVRLSKTVGGSVFAAGSKVVTSTDAVVHGAVFAAGSDLTLAGDLQDSLYAAGSTVNIDGRVSRDAALAGSQIKLSDQARISGNLKYASNAAVTLPNDSAVGGSVVRSEVRQPSATERLRLRFLDAVYWLLANILIAAVAWRVVPQVLRRSSIAFTANPGSSIGRGLAILFLTPVALVLGMLTFIGLPLVLIAVLAYILVLLVASLFAANYIGALIWSRTQGSKPKHEYWQELGATSMGFLAITIAAIIPIFGDLLSGLIGILGVSLVVASVWPVAKAPRPKRVAS